jgi:CheY-like chemotaxis protein
MADSPPPIKARILIVDDEPFNVDLLVQELEDRDYITDTAFGGREALEKVAADPPDLILLDVMMPDIDGITVCRMLKEDPATHLIPIVIMTSLDATEDRVRGIEAGADDFLTKPVDDRELLARIRTALKTKRVVDQAVGELRSASAQLDRMGAREEDLSVLVIGLEWVNDGGEIPAEAGTFLLDRYRTMIADVLAMFSGEVSESIGKRIVAVIRSPDAESHPRLAVEAAMAVQAEMEAQNRNNPVGSVIATIGIDSGKASVGSVRVERAEGAVWALKIEGPALERALRLAEGATPGSIAHSENTQTRAGSGAAVGPGDGSPAMPGAELVESDREQPAPTQRGSLLWPSEYGDLEAKVWSNWGIEDLYFNRVLSGKSGALVYAVDITARDYSGQAILKFSEVSNAAWGKKDEASRHNYAVEANPVFAERHLPAIVATLVRDQHMAVLSTIAARGLEYAMPWSHCHFDVQIEAARQVSSGLLEAWNTSYHFAEGVVRPADLMDSWLSYRLDPGRGGRLHDLLSAECGINPEVATFFYDGHWYPNPLAFAVGSVDVREHLALRAVAGNLHGDLHGYNVLVGTETDQVAYHLIDLAFYKPDAYLLFDHAYFEISHLLEQRGSVSLGDWLAVVDALERGTTPRADDVGLIQLLGAVRKEVVDWVNQREPNRLSYLESQFMLARVATGLNFGHKRLSVGLRVRAILYAAECLKSYLKFHKVDWPKHGDVLGNGGNFPL